MLGKVHNLVFIGSLLISGFCFSCDDEVPEPPMSLTGGQRSQGGSENQDLSCPETGLNGEREGEACGCGGSVICSLGQLSCVGGSQTNSCGGCGSLTHEPQTPCGECGQGEWQCNGVDAVMCLGDEANVCGGCQELIGAPGDPCDQCGTLSCVGTESLVCDERVPNACGGCMPLDERPGEPCGDCGTWSCDQRGGLICDDPGPNTCRAINLILMGDTGEANEAQYRVSAGAQARCDRAGGCEGFLLLGDNIYDTGAESAMDEQLTTKIDLPYANLRKGPAPSAGEPDNRARLPIFATLGNHDLGGAGINSAQVQYYLAYARANDWFYYPSEYWELQIGHVHLVSLHTNPLAYGIPDDQFGPQGALVDRVMMGSSATWKLVFGHHPYRSNGQHGNAGSYELGFDLGNYELFGIDLSNLFGDGFREWIDQYVCNKADFYISGHDHNRQWLSSVPMIPNLPEGAGTAPCHTHFAVSGAGAKTTDLVGRGNVTDYEDDREEGFLFMSFYPDRVEVEFCDGDGNTQWSKTITKP